MGDYQRELDALWKTDPALAAKLVDLERRELELGTLRTERDELVRKARERRTRWRMAKQFWEYMSCKRVGVKV